MNKRSDQGVNVSLWVAYAAVFFICWFFYNGVFSHFPLMGSVPFCVPVVVAFTAVMEGSLPGSLYGLCVGLFSCLAQGGSRADLIFLGALIGMFAGLWHERKLKHPVFPSLFSALVALVGVELVECLGRALFGSGAGAATLLRIAIFEILYSMILAVLAYPLFRFVRRRFGSS